MLYHDPLYGSCEISEPVLLDLISSQAMQRLKGISQHGITALLGITAPFSRFDHSVGAMLLVRRLGAPIAEQIAALLHDVSHTAFSHVIDFVFDDQKMQSYHDEKKQEYLASTDIPEILSKHQLDWYDFIDETKFSLLEQPAPALCADRLDYFFRDLEFLKLATAEEITAAIASLEVAQNQIVTTELNIASWLAYTYIATDKASWSNKREVGLYQLTAEAIKVALENQIITESDFWLTDQILWHKLNNANLASLQQLITLITPGTRFEWNPNKPDLKVASKVRSIDPHIKQADTILPLSGLDEQFAQFRKQYHQSKQGLWPLVIIKAPAMISNQH